MQTILPSRRGPRPTTTPRNPHSQLDQIAPTDLQDELRDYALALPGVRRGTSQVSVPGSIAFFLDAPPHPATIPDLLGGEWGHIHPHHDGSLHLHLPPALAETLIEAGWVEYHSLVRLGALPPLVVMLYGPRDREEFEVARAIVDEAYLAAGGAPDGGSDGPRGLARIGGARGHH